MPEVSLPCKMRSMSRLALSSPSAFFNTERTYSLVSLTSELSLAVCASKRAMTLATRSLGIAFILAMDSPRLCTSLGVMCLSTDDASSSPSDISKMAASSTPVSSKA